MTETILTGPDFDHDIARAKRATENGPVIITDAGRPAYVLLRHEEYARLTAHRPTIIDMLAMPGVGDIDFVPGKLDIRLKPAEFDSD